MVLESLVAELLNRYIGDYVENLDPKQLNLGIWGGDVKLSNLQLKASALDDLDLPFKITSGRLSNLVLKIPWKNLYKQPVVVTVSGLYLVAIPNIGLQYNKEKEEKEAIEGKQRELRRLEDAKKLQKAAADGGAAAQQNDSFVEKMATQVIKNLQVDVSDIHVRFEDKFSSPKSPFACGLTLKKLNFVTTDGLENWLGNVVTDASKFVYKLVNLEALSIYWNPLFKESFNDMGEAELTKAFVENIAEKDRKISSLSYVLEPIHFKCNLRLNPKPENDGSSFEIPKIDLKLTLESLALSLTRKQYEGVILFADALDTVTLKSKYRKYGPPDHPIQQDFNAKEWWHYAQRCIMESDVKPRLEGWSWNHIKAHREKLRRYRRLYTQKLVNLKVTPAVINELDALERELTVFNIVLMRQQSDLDAKKLKPPQQEQAVGWWGWMTGKGKQPQVGEGDLEKKLADIMTPEEKSKLFEAIDYKEGAPIAMYPKTFIENRFDVKLSSLTLSVIDDSHKDRSSSVMILSLCDVQSQVEQRPSAGGLKVQAVIRDLSILGSDRNGKRPEIMVPSRNHGEPESLSLLEVLFETKPLDCSKDTRIRLVASPVRAVYDAETINDVVGFFKPPESLHLKQLQVAAAAKFQELKESSTAGLRYSLENHKEIDLDVHLNASYLIIPEKGVYDESHSKLIADFGDMRMRNVNVPDRVLKRGEDNLEKLEESLYDKYSIDFQKIQIIFAEAGDKWASVRHADHSPLHILQPLNCSLEFHQCIVQNDPKRPLLRVVGELPSIAVDMTDERLLELCKLALSVPLPESAPPDPTQSNSSHDAFKKELQREAMSMARSNKDLKVAQELFMDADEGFLDQATSEEESEAGDAGNGEIFFDALDSDKHRTKRRKSSHGAPRFKTAEVNFTTFQMRFQLNDISLSIFRGKSLVPLVKLQLATIITEVYMRTFDMEVALALADIIVDYTRASTEETIRMLRRHQERSEDSRGVLLQLDYRSAKSNAPDFERTYNKTLQKLQADFVGLDIVLDREGLVEMKQFASDLQEQLNALMPKKEEDIKEAPKDEPDVNKEQTEEQTILVGQKSAGVIQLDINARLHILTLSLLTGKRELAFCALKDISAQIISDAEKMDVNAQLKRIKIKYPLPMCLYPHIVRSLSDEVLSVHYVGFTQPAVKTDVSSHDMAVSLNLGAIEIVFLNKFVVEILDFFASFQTAQAKLLEVTSTATESAMQSVKTAYKDAVRIKMDINIRAPVVIMPQNSRSANAVLVDLGRLLLQNRFQLTKESAIMDEMKLDFAAVKLSRLIYGPNQKIKKEMSLLSQPQPMELKIVRNLSGMWFTGAPDMSLVGGLKALELRLSKFDYAVLMAVLAENFAEGGPSAPPPKSTLPSPDSIPSNSLSLDHVASATEKPPVPLASAEVFTKIKVDFSIGVISAKLYLTELPDMHDVAELEKTEALCGAEIVEMGAHVQMFSDTSMTVTATLGNITLDDLRQNLQLKHRRMLERKAGPAPNAELLNRREGTTESNMLNFKLEQLPNTDRNLDVVVSNIQANLAMSFYLGILEFITSTPTAQEDAPSTAVFEISEMGTSMPTSGNLRPPTDVKRQVSRATTKSEAAKKPPTAIRPTNVTRINVVVQQPDIILIEDLTLSDSRVLVLKTEVGLIMTITPDKSNMDLSCNQLQMFLSTYEQRNEQLKPILIPVEIGMHASTPFGGSQKLAISAGYINLTISPVAVQTILGVLSGLGQSGTQEVKVAEVANHDGLWNPKAVDSETLWFLKDDSDDEWMDLALEQAIDNVVDDVFSSGDQLSLNTESIVVILETSYGSRTIPMLLAEAKFNCIVDDFSRKMHCIGTMQLEVSYYNDLYDVWEPLLEPVEDGKSCRPWQVQVDVKKNITANENVQTLARMASSANYNRDHPPVRRGSSGSMTTSSSMTSVSEATEALKQMAAMTVTITAMDPLQLTISKRTLDVITKMSESFTAAVSQQAMIQVFEATSPYVVYNDAGVDLVVTMTGSLRLANKDDRNEVMLRPGGRVDLCSTAKAPQLTASVLRMHERMSANPPMIRVKIGTKTADILVSRAETRFYFFENPADQSKPFRLIAEIRSEMGHKEIVLRSTLQVENLLPTPVAVLCGAPGKAVPLGIVPPGGFFNVPIGAVQNHDVTGLSFKPAEYDYLSVSNPLTVDTVFSMANDGVERLLQCPANKTSPSDKMDNFYFNVFSKYTRVRYGNTHTVTPNSQVYQVSLKPVYSVANLLPIPLSIQVEGALEDGLTLPPGGSASICNARVGENQLKFTLESFAQKTWAGSLPLINLVDEMVNLTLTWGGTETLNLGIRNVKEQGTNFLSVYAPVWIMNKTGIPLHYKDPLILHREDLGQVPVLFSGKTLNSKKRVAIQAPDSEWSEKFSLDTVGSSGVLACNKPDGSLAYEFGVSIKPSAVVLTRLVVITPYYLFNNNSNVNLAVREEHMDAKWIIVPKNSCRPFWPQYLSSVLCCRIEGSDEMTTAFAYGVLQTVLLRLTNKYGGIYVQTQVSESNVTCSFSLYKPGTAAALLINNTSADIRFKQQEWPDGYAVLPPGCQQLFTWPLPALERSFIWTIAEEQNKPLDLNRDDAGLCYLPGENKTQIFWVAFLDGVQRVLLFTDKQIVAHQCVRSLENEISNMELNVALDCIGLSLVDNKVKREVLYMGIVSPGPVWMGRKIGQPGKKLKAMSVAESKALESAYQHYLMLRERDKGRSPLSQIIREGAYEVTFDSTGPALMTQPKQREIQRTYQPGFWARHRSSDHHTQVHLKLHRLQLDNPATGSRYQVVLFPVPLPATADYKPFTEVSVVLRNAQNSSITQYKLMTALIQEFELRIDQTFLSALIAMFSGDITNSFEERTKMLDSFRTRDLAEIPRSLEETVAIGQGEERQAYYEKLMLQPIKIHLSFSLSGGQVEKRSGLAMPAEFISLFIKSIGVTITEANDVVLKLGTFERDYRFISQKQLTGEVQSHYTAQVVKQVYMLVFGLDILGNPFGLVRGITDGVKDLFYEPYLGAVEGPEEFMAGLSSGMKNFIGSTIGGTMGAVGRVTGTLGRAVAALSFDQEFQQRRQAELNRSGGDFAGGMASSGRHLVSGVVEGVTGVFKRPLEGAKEEGVEGFVKGLGKGFIGLIARPTTGLIDFASGSLNTLGRAVKGDNQVEWLRMPRFISSDGIVRPYNVHQAEGSVIFRNVKNGEYAKTDEYITHLVTARDRRYILMLTNKRVICLEKGDVIHDWNVEWSFPIEHMPEPPNVDAKGLCVYITDNESKPLGGLFHRAKKSKRVFVEDRDSGSWFCAKVAALWKDMHPKT